MVKTRPTNQSGKFPVKSTRNIINYFGKRLTHQKITETIDVNGKVTGKSTASAAFTGEIQYGPKIDKMYAEMGTIDVGDAILFVSPTETEATNIVALKSLIVNGTTTGSTYDAYSVVGVLNAPELGGTVDFYMLHLKKRQQVTL